MREAARQILEEASEASQTTSREQEAHGFTEARIAAMIEKVAREWGRYPCASCGALRAVDYGDRVRGRSWKRG
jgi:hypothetical protein